MSIPENRARYSARAIRDLGRIRRYGLENWGPTTTEDYVTRIADTVSLLVENPQLGVLREDILQNLRSIPSEQHVVFYSIIRGEIVVRAIVHQRMNLDAINFR